MVPPSIPQISLLRAQNTTLGGTMSQPMCAVLAQHKQIFPWPGPLSPVTTPCSSHCSGEHACSQLAGNPLARRPVQVWLFVNHEHGIQVSNQGSLAFLFFTPHAWCTRDLCLHCVCAFSLPCSLECSWWRKGSLLGLVVLPPSVLHLWGRSRGKWRPCPPVQGTFLCPACTPSTAPLWQK